MIEIGQRVRIGDLGVSVFEVLELEDPEHALIESVQLDAAGRYPFSMPVRALRVVE